MCQNGCMGKAQTPKPILERLLEFLRVLLTLEVGQALVMLAQVMRALRSILINKRHGIYEVLSHDSTVEILDSKGREVVVTRLEEVRFLRDNTIAFYDNCWGDGNFLAEYECSPGVPVDLFTDGSQKRILISLRETKNRGDVLLFRIRRKIEGGFTQREEWWETEILHQTRWIKVRIIFPKDRPCQRATVTQKSGDKTSPLGEGHFRYLADGRQELSWEIAHPTLHDSYIIKWLW